MKKLITAIIIASMACGAQAFHGHHGFHHFGPHPIHHYHHCGGWEVAGAVVGAGIVGAALYSAVRPPVAVVQPAPVVVQPATTVVVQQPVQTVVQTIPAVQPATTTVVTQPMPVTTVQNVWVEGCYVDQVQANGVVTRVWRPGHYEQRTVTVQ